MFDLNPIQLLCIFALPVLFGITLHEVAHGWVANRLGDPTARMLGRLTINPVKHIDLVGTIIVPCALFFLGGFIFGWAKPVPISPHNFKNPKRDKVLVALAGPTANFLMALFWGLIAKLGVLLASSLHQSAVAIVYMGIAGIMINILLMIFNLLPIPPLDGSYVVAALLRGKAYDYYRAIEPYGNFILLFLLVTGSLFVIIGPLVTGLQSGITHFFLG